MIRICVTLRFRLLIETHFNALQLKNVISAKKHFLINPIIILYHTFT